jgi:hypothetical protein
MQNISFWGRWFIESPFCFKGLMPAWELFFHKTVHGFFDYRYKFCYRDACLCVCICVCVCVSCVCACMNLHIPLTAFLYECIYIRLKISARYGLCPIQWTVCAFLQGGCSRHVTYVGIHHHGRRDFSQWVNSGYKPIRFSLTKPVIPSTLLVWASSSYHTCAISDSF